MGGHVRKRRFRLPLLALSAQPRVGEIVARTIEMDTHNHVDVPLTEADTPGPDLDLTGEMKRSGLAAICMTFATDYQQGDTCHRFLKGLARTLCSTGEAYFEPSARSSVSLIKRV
jgi:hypothetical protein